MADLENNNNNVATSTTKKVKKVAAAANPLSPGPAPDVLPPVEAVVAKKVKKVKEAVDKVAKDVSAVEKAVVAKVSKKRASSSEETPAPAAAASPAKKQKVEPTFVKSEHRELLELIGSGKPLLGTDAHKRWTAMAKKIEESFVRPTGDEGINLPIPAKTPSPTFPHINYGALCWLKSEIAKLVALEKSRAKGASSSSSSASDESVAMEQ